MTDLLSFEKVDRISPFWFRQHSAGQGSKFVFLSEFLKTPVKYQEQNMMIDEQYKITSKFKQK